MDQSCDSAHLNETLYILLFEQALLGKLELTIAVHTLATTTEAISVLAAAVETAAKLLEPIYEHVGPVVKLELTSLLKFTAEYFFRRI